MQEEEIYRDVVGFEGLYWVSNHGAVKNGRKILRATATRTDYKEVHIQKGNYKNTARVHRLVAEAFIPNPENKREVNHKDGDKLNNHANNLEWVTSKENREHSIRVLGNPAPPKQRLFGTAHHNSRQLAQSRDGIDIAYYESMQAVRRAGYWPDDVKLVCDGKRELNRGYKWRYITKEEYINATQK